MKNTACLKNYLFKPTYFERGSIKSGFEVFRVPSISLIAPPVTKMNRGCILMSGVSSH